MSDFTLVLETELWIKDKRYWESCLFLQSSHVLKGYFTFSLFLGKIVYRLKFNCSRIYCLPSALIILLHFWRSEYLLPATSKKALGCLVAKLYPALCDSMDCSPPGSSVHGIFPGRNPGMGCHFLLQRIFLTQGLRWQANSLLTAPREAQEGPPFWLNENV